MRSPLPDPLGTSSEDGPGGPESGVSDPTEATDEEVREAVAAVEPRPSSPSRLSVGVAADLEDGWS